MSKKVLMGDIAEALGVSKTTVSRAFNDAEGISKEQREKVLQKAKEMNYRFNSSAKALKTNKTQNIGVIIDKFFLEKGEGFYSQIFRHIVEILGEKKYNCILEIYVENQIPLFLKDNKVDGVLIVGQLPKDYLDLIKLENCPVVLIDDQNKKYDCIYTNNFLSTAEAVNFLIKKNHREIGFVGNVKSTRSVADRYFGYMMGLKNADIEINEMYNINDRDSNNKSIELVLPEKLPTAFVCNNDRTALNLISKLKENGYSVPEDISVIGFDNTIYSDLNTPKITTMEVSMEIFAREGIRLLLERIEDNDKPILNLSLKADIIIKETVREL